jgi:hypothetical protein
VACIRLHVIAIRFRLANITGPPCRVSHEDQAREHYGSIILRQMQRSSGFRHASYANPSRFRTPEISQRGSPPLAPPVALESLPPAQARTKQRGSRRTLAAKEPLAASSLPTRPAHACLPFKAVSGRNRRSPTYECRFSYVWQAANVCCGLCSEPLFFTRDVGYAIQGNDGEGASEVVEFQANPRDIRILMDLADEGTLGFSWGPSYPNFLEFHLAELRRTSSWRSSENLPARHLSE